MRKKLIIKTAVFAMTAALLLPATIYAAPPTTPPVELSVKQDGKAHKVFVFGTSLALMSTDGSTEISNMGPVGRVDVMIDGNVTTNVATINIPAGHLSKLALEEGSVLIKNVSPETGAAVKKQISDAYAAGATTVDLASLANVTAYKVNENGSLTNAAGSTVSAVSTGVSVSSVAETSASFTAEIQEIIVREAAEAAEKAAREAMAIAPAPAPAPASSVSGNSVDTGDNDDTNDDDDDNEVTE